MSANATTAAPAGRKKLAQGKERSDVALGYDSQSTLSLQGAKELPSGWEWRSFRDATVNHDGRRVPIKEADRAKRSGPYPYYGASGIIDDIDDYLFDGDFLLVAEDGANLLSRSTPIAFKASGKFWVNNHAHVVQGAEGVVQSYLEHFLNSIDLKFFVTGSAQPKLTQANLNKISLPLAPEREQHRIVAEIEKQFTRLEAGVAALRRVQANLKRYRAAVLKAACEGKLVPTEAELSRVGRVPSRGVRAKTKNAVSGNTDYNDAPFEFGEQLLKRILAERRKNWTGRGQYKEPATPDTANLQPLPEGWTWASVEQLSTQVQYGSSAKTNEDAAGVPVLRMGNIQEGKFDFHKLKYLPASHDEFPELLLAKGDLLFNRTNSAELVGKTAVFRGTPEPCSFASYLIRVRLCDGCLPDLVAYFINSVFGRAWIAGCVSQQVGQANVNGTKLQALAIPLPPLAEQTRIVAEVERRLSVVEELESVVTANLQRAVHLRQSILQKAFTGELV